MKVAHLLTCSLQTLVKRDRIFRIKRYFNRMVEDGKKDVKEEEKKKSEGKKKGKVTEKCV